MTVNLFLSKQINVYAWSLTAHQPHASWLPYRMFKESTNYTPVYCMTGNSLMSANTIKAAIYDGLRYLLIIFNGLSNQPLAQSNVIKGLANSFTNPAKPPIYHLLANTTDKMKVLGTPLNLCLTSVDSGCIFSRICVEQIILLQVLDCLSRNKTHNGSWTDQRNADKHTPQDPAIFSSYL